MKTAFHLTAALSAVVMLSAPAFADSETVRCKGGIVSVGDSAGEVLAKCGQPATTSQSSKKVVQKEQSGPTRSITNIIVDNWIFNFGPNEFQYQLELQDGRVSRIQSLDYGY
ncbi:DUF2845 domain-containing protein [Geomonas sp. Red69]|uniref:DUF2845 domain-containing protein n=1 Tax=Geomonas diazotrophica TaxID=2843197 RepID=A0ABX8JDP0_9BACT|nr:MULTISPECIES: DUF2845 domain-containing protein [Geomonas]MBU5638174.1 DUF2845 domain-containing protein [Geomonas diazotrophica]QWV95893.1 DUF2845 domain-containing protein [Geomonas nitrogeniifigens]QXE84979.1 DUF2845 domain-containing protein [Geomonas nitrogeniifigens]